MTLASSYLNTSIIPVTIEAVHESPSLELSVEKPIISLGETQTVHASTNKADEVWFVVDGGIKKVGVVNSKASVNFKTTRLGKNVVKAFTPDGNVAQAYFSVIKQTNISITDLKSPAEAVVGKKFRVEVTVENKGQKEEVLVEASFDRKSQMQKVSLDGKKEISFEFTPEEKGTKELCIKVRDGGEARRVSLITVHSVPRVSLSSKHFVWEGGKVKVLLKFDASSEATQVKFRIGDYILNGTEGSVELSPGEYVVSWEWKDALGNIYTDQEWIKVPHYGEIGSILPSSEENQDLWGGFLFLLVILAIVLFIAVLSFGTYILVYKKFARKD